MLFGLLTGLGLLFWLGLLALLVIATFLTELENFGWATVVLLGTVFSVQFCHHFLNIDSPLEWAGAHVGTTLLLVLGYLAVGVVWSFVKWFSFLMGFRDAYRTAKEKFVADYNALHGPLPEVWTQDVFQQFRKSIGYHNTYHGNDLITKPRATNNKARIVAWMAFFPCSMIGTLLNDPVRRLFNFLFASFKALYQQMADAVFRNDKELQ